LHGLTYVIRFDGAKLPALMEGELARRNVDPVSIRHVVASLVQTSLRGVDSHGISLFPHYCRAVMAGRINARPRISISHNGPSCATVDADHAFGHHAGAVAMEEAIVLACRSGMGAVSVKNSTHFGAAAYFGLLAAEHDCVGFAFTNADALVKAFGAREAFFGTNPICFTAPLQSEGPFCLDMATSLVSWNRITNFRREDRSIPPHWAFDREGQSVTDPHAARCLNPAGEYKGFGLGMMIDILCAILANGPIGRDIAPMYSMPLDSSKRRVSHFFMALDISRFIEPADFKSNLQAMVDRVRSLPPLTAGATVMVAGDPEKRSLARRTSEGIPIDHAKYDEFLALNPEFESGLAR
jgi:ureidoglycolate dehydrogenase (NAD+)